MKKSFESVHENKKDRSVSPPPSAYRTPHHLGHSLQVDTIGHSQSTAVVPAAILYSIYICFHVKLFLFFISLCSFVRYSSNFFSRKEFTQLLRNCVLTTTRFYLWEKIVFCFIQSYRFSFMIHESLSLSVDSSFSFHCGGQWFVMLLQSHV